MALFGSITSPVITGNTNIESNTLFVDSVQDRVGIGTSNPGGKLDVIGTSLFRGTVGGRTLKIAEGGVSSIGFDIESDTNAGDLTLSSAYNSGLIAFKVAGSERVRISNAGNITKPTIDTNIYYRSQWVSGYKSYGTTSGAWVPIFFCDHTHSLTYNFMVVHPSGPPYGAGSVCGFSSITYGGGNGPTNTQSGVLGGGYITSLSARYNNAGYQIEIQVNGTFGGNAPRVYWQVIGCSVDPFYAL